MNGGPVVPEDPTGSLAVFLDHLCGERLLFFPIRHHSPACAWHLRQLIRKAQPASILIEGPETFDRFVADLQRSETVAPVAIYTHVIERQDTRGRGGEIRGEERRSGSFYPLCDYSPELVALREAAGIGARVGFCDLEYPRQVRSEEAELRERRRLTSLLSEAHLQESTYLRALAERTGCRDPHELWDRLFESRFREIATHEFVRQVAAYCWFARAHAPTTRLERDGTVAREAHMAARIERELARLRRAARETSREAGGEGRGPLLVVTGGFHTPALALGWARTWKVEPPPEPEERVFEALIPYGFAQLDALNGYAAGMPSPGFYQRLWETAGECASAIHESVALDLLTELPARLRTAGASLQLSTADAIAAFAQAVLLARARGNDGPAREDLLDGMRSCFVKGELDVEGQLVLDLALELMRGDRVGCLPPEVKLHPLVADFRSQAEALHLALDTGTPRELALEIYRKSRHQQISRWFHRLAFLEVPYARFIGGPDFVMSRDLDLQVEHWECAWSPNTDSALIEKGLYGSTIEQACLARLHEFLARLEEEHGEAGAFEAVRAVALCLRLDLGAHLPVLVAAAQARLAAEGRLGQCAEAAAQLQALLRLRGPISDGATPEVRLLAVAAYERSCLLVRDLPRCPPAGEPDALAALTRLRELVVENPAEDQANAGVDGASSATEAVHMAPANRVGPPAAPLDATLLWHAARTALAEAGSPEAVRGGLAGLLFSCGQLSATELEAQVLAGLQGTGPQGSTAPAYLHGLFTLCREITWQFPAIVRRIDELLGGWDDSEFDRALPFLRLAFAQHTPRETDRVALLLKQLYGSESPLDWYSRVLDEAFVHGNVALAARVEATLRQDGLGHFLAEPVPG